MTTPVEQLSFIPTGASTKRSLGDWTGDIVNVKNFGAIGNNSNDDTNAIQGAINYALTKGNPGDPFLGNGAIVFFPPGHYKVTAPLTANVAATQVSLLGSGRNCTQIEGNFWSYVIDHQDNEIWGGITHIQGLNVLNRKFLPQCGAIRLNYSQNTSIRDCYIQGFNGIDMSSDIFNNLIENTIFGSPLNNQIPGSVGIYAAQLAIVNCDGNGWDTGIMFGSTAKTDTRTIQSISWSGGVATVTVSGYTLDSIGWTTGTKLLEVFFSNPFTYNTGYVYGTYVNTTQFTYPLPEDPGAYVGSAKWAIGVSSGAAGFSCVGVRVETSTTGIMVGKTLSGDVSQSGGIIAGFTTERCGTSLNVVDGVALQVNGGVFTGTIGPGKTVNTLTWNAGSGGFVTVDVSGQGYTLDDLEWPSGTRNVSILNSNPSGYNIAGFAIGTRTSSTTFTYPKASDPGPYVGGATFSMKCQYGLRIGTAQAATFSGLAAGVDPEFNNIDFVSSSLTDVALIACFAGGSWGMPAAAQKSDVSFVQCDNTAIGMVFADLPGQAGVHLTTPIQGMKYYITNAAKSGGGTAAWGDALQGGGSQTIWATYDGSVWRAG